MCSYACFMSQFAPGAAPHSNCWLSRRPPAGAAGSLCASGGGNAFPATPSYPGM